MAGGWARDGNVQEQIDASVADGVARVRSHLARGPSRAYCEECDEPIPEARRRAVAGVRLCVSCQKEADAQRTYNPGYNRRGSKGSQLK